MNPQHDQINAKAEERFQTQSKNNLTIKNSTYKDIALNQAQSKEHWNEEIQQLQQREKFTQIENLIYHLK